MASPTSRDKPDRHASFAESLNLPYPLLSDPRGEIARAYGVARGGGWLPNRRATFVIDRGGVVRKVIRAELSGNLLGLVPTAHALRNDEIPLTLFDEVGYQCVASLGNRLVSEDESHVGLERRR